MIKDFLEDHLVPFAVLCSLIIFFCLGVFVGQNTLTKAKNLYSLTTIVLEVSPYNDTVTVQDFNGSLWQFKGVEDWDAGDVCSCLMDSKGTPEIKDDEIVSARYCGYFSGWKD